jgi:hypothetical protein
LKFDTPNSSVTGFKNLNVTKKKRLPTRSRFFYAKY